ncbi:MAG: TylF/MycF family methyltransferase [Prevotellaceae bacterium]|jgi:hypothetical protein|nr:TylF/MycF family methyltransferase [Prevotellaceae bacterium]
MNLIRKIKKMIDKKASIDMDKEFFPLYEQCAPYTLTSIERMYALYQAVKYVVQQQLDGDFVECGVWKGGSSMLMAATLNYLKCYTKKIYLYDTFEGMAKPTAQDIDYAGVNASVQLKNAEQNKKTNNIWAYCSLEDVKHNFEKINYPSENLLFIKGKVEDTIATNQHKVISILRLDTDWYESTYHEMVYLYPSLISKGVLIIDDYGHWQGARGAIDKYCMENKLPILLNRIDYTGRIAIKI